jgi:hypothetical protein
MPKANLPLSTEPVLRCQRCGMQLAIVRDRIWHTTYDPDTGAHRRTRTGEDGCPEPLIKTP